MAEDGAAQVCHAELENDVMTFSIVKRVSTTSAPLEIALQSLYIAPEA